MSINRNKFLLLFVISSMLVTVSSLGVCAQLVGNQSG